MKKVLKFISRAVLYLLLISMAYVIVCKWVNPPITITQINALIEGDGLKRDYISWGEMPKSIKLAAIASEDQLFMEHDGFDWAALKKSIEGKSGKGSKAKPKGAAASTISQQVAKNVFLWQGHGVMKYVRKALEFFYTKSIELVWGKKRILEVYLNVIEMGEGIYGIEAASQTYFEKPASKLTNVEAAMIVAALPNPKKYTVKPMSGRVKWRYAQILRQMKNMSGYPKVKALLQ